jgi:predicted acyl esterase
MPKMALRLDICGQNFPLHDRNANTGKAILEDTTLVTSKHTIFHDKTRPAKLILPVLK